MEFTRIEEFRHTSRKKFLRAASEYYGINEGPLSAFLEHYDIEPNGAMGPSGSDAAPLLLSEIAEGVGLSVPVVARLQKTGVISTPITYDDIPFLQGYRQALADIPLQASLQDVLIAEPDFTETWKKWIYSKFFFTDTELRFFGRMASLVWQSTINQIAEDVGKRYGISIYQSTRDEIFEIRETAYNDREKVNRGEASENSVLRSRGLPESEFEMFKETFVFDLYS